jgi:hypothetical protein
MDRRCAGAVSGIARRISSSGRRNQHSEIISDGRRSAVGDKTECDAVGCINDKRRAILANASAFGSANAALASACCILADQGHSS